MNLGKQKQGNMKLTTMTKIISYTFWVIFIQLVPYPLFAESTHPLKFLPGGKATLMGGAYTSISDDPSGIFYNPAGPVWKKTNEFSINSVALYKRKITYHEILGSHNFSENSSSFIPLSFGSTYKLNNNLSAGYSIFSTDQEETKQNNQYSDITYDSFTIKNYHRYIQKNISLSQYGGFLSYKNSENSSFGGSLIYYTSQNQGLIHEKTTYSSNHFQTYDYSSKRQEQGFNFTLGLLYKFRPITVGLAAKMVFKTSSSQENITDQTNVNIDQQDPIIQKQSENSDFVGSNDSNHHLIRLGVNTPITKHCLLALDTIYHVKRNDSSNKKDLQNIINYSTGANCKVDKYYVTGGFFTNNDMSQPLEMNLNEFASHVNFTGLSLGGGIQLKGSNLSAGLVYQSGQGHARKILSSDRISDISAYSIMYLISMEFRS